MFVSGLEVLPEGYKLKRVLGIVESTIHYEISKKSLWKRMTEATDDADPFDRVTDWLKSEAKKLSANGLIGIKASTSTQGFGNGMFMYITLVGTAVELDIPDED